MPEKTYGEKLTIGLMRLLLAQRPVAQAELQAEMQCSRQTVGRVVRDIETCCNVTIVSQNIHRRKYYRLRPAPAVCSRLFEKGVQQLGLNQLVNHHLGNIRMGSVDYSGHQAILSSLFQALQQKRVCEVTYQALDSSPKTYCICPYKLFVHQGSIYLHAGRYRPPHHSDAASAQIFTLAIHRLQHLTLTRDGFQIPSDYDFDELFNQSFGLIKGASFSVTLRLSGFAALWVPERIWGGEQKIRRLSGGRIKLSFTASSKPEVTAWILSLGNEAHVVGPAWLREDIAAIVKAQHLAYSREKQFGQQGRRQP